MDRTIHILGLGNIGKYIAHGLIRGARQQGASPAASCRKPTVTLLFHRPGMLDEWEKASYAIDSTTLETASSQSSNSSVVKSTHAQGFHVELLNAGETTPIKNLIVATKTYTTTSALAPLRHRLGRDSHILFVQNGMGVTDDVSSQLFPDPATRPTYWAGICSAGVYSQGPFSIIHAGRGPLRFGMVQSLSDGHAESETSGSKRTSNALLDALLDADILQPELLTPTQILEAQLEKLVINSVINPLTALKGCKNGEVFNGQDGDSDCRVLVHEAGAIVRELLRRRSAGATKDSSTGRDFSDSALLEAVRRVASATAGNTSSMLQDVRAGRETEIDFINGYLVRQAEVLGLPCERHKELVARVKEMRG